jgi:predicted nucleic acid-binding protein
MACADSADPDNVRACAARDAALKAGQTLIATDFVADETLTLIRFRLGLNAAHAWSQQVDGSSRLRWERVDAERFEKAHNLFFQYRDKDFSFTDCASFVIMRELRLTHAVTTTVISVRWDSRCCRQHAGRGALNGLDSASSLPCAPRGGRLAATRPICRI